MDDNSFETIAIRNQIPRTLSNEHSVPIYLTSSFIFKTAEDLEAAFNGESDAYVYSRYTNPNTDEFVNKICVLEKAESGVGTSSGMAAIYATFMSLLQSGDNIISCSSVFGATHTILNKYLPPLNITSNYFDIADVNKIESLITPNTKLIYLETPTNPAIDIIDLEFMGKVAKKNNLILIVDNCFATPYIQNPIDFGADLVIHSATKYIDGQGRVLGGVVVGRKDIIDKIYLFARIIGVSISPFNSWILSKSLETLAIRMEKHSYNAFMVAQFLESDIRIEKVSYPFLPNYKSYAVAKKQMKLGGGLVSFVIKGGITGARKFLNSLKMIKISPNLGDTRTIATHPASSTHCKLTPAERLRVGISDGLIRISVGLENIEDIIKDIYGALSSKML